MEKYDSNLDGLYQQLADRFRALSQLFGELSSSQTAQKLTEGLLSGDAATFNQFVDRIDIPMLGKCAWVREIIERVMVTPAGFVRVCRLRDNLTLEESLLYLQIARRHGQFQPVVVSTVLTVAEDRPVIPPGPFLEELRANNLVTCDDPPQMTYDVSTTLVLSKPERICV